MSAATAFIRRKVPVPSEMLTRDWDRVAVATRERAFFMASVAEHEILDVFKRHTEAVTDGKMSTAEAREKIRVDLQKLGYAPKPGTEGSIKDLSSFRRINTVVETNGNLAQGWGQHQRRLAGMRISPAKQMYRQVLKREPRNWPLRWRVASAGLSKVGINVEEMSAHLLHPIWRAISRFGVPYPIYDFGSGMFDKTLRMADAVKLGVDQPPPAGPVDVPAEVPGVGTLQPSLNENLEASPEITREDVWQSLEKQLGHTVKRVKGPSTVAPASSRSDSDKRGQDARATVGGTKLIYLDPNGTRPDTAENLANIVGRRPFPGAPVYQFEAAAQYAREGPEAFSRGSDALYDMARLVHRTIPMESPPPLWHGHAFNDSLSRDMWLESLSEGLLPSPGWPFMVTDTRPDFVLSQIGEQLGHSVIVSIRGARTARDLRPVLRTVGGENVPGVFIEPGTRLRIVESRVTPQGITHIIAEEVQP